MSDIRQIILENARRARIQPVRGEHVPVVNCTAFADEVCAEMLRLFPEAPFTACWYERTDGSQLWMLRRRNAEDGAEEWIEPVLDVEALMEERDELQRELTGYLHHSEGP